jgi:leader peptidase (prepilin peptidase)/N-methyltransferase
MSGVFQTVFAFVFGCVIGSFLNVVRHRLPKKANLVSGRSMCPQCGHVIAWYDNIPVLSFIILRRRCRSCGWRIPWIYPVIEISTGVCFALIWHAFLPGEAVAYWILTSLLIVCAGIDFDLRIIPDKLTLPGVIMGVIFSVTLLAGAGPRAGLLKSLGGIAAGAGVLVGIALIYKVVRGIEGMGFGDVKLMAMVGAFLGYKSALVTIFLGSLVGGIVGIFLMRRSAEGMKTAVPFGVFLSPAAIFCIFYGEGLVDAYLGLLK